MSEKEESSETNTQKKITSYKRGFAEKEFIRRLRPEKLNLMNEFTDAEMFLIDGDSLFLQSILDDNLDWNYGGQFLHLVYLCERYLHLFIRKGAVFQLVFFRGYEDMWKSVPSLFLARQSLKMHLSRNINYKTLCDFHNPWGLPFSQYVKNFCPSFMLLSDGQFQQQLSSKPFDDLPKQVSELFFCQLNRILQLRINCAFTSRIEFGTSSLNGYHIKCSTPVIKLSSFVLLIVNELKSCEFDNVDISEVIIDDIVKSCDSQFKTDDQMNFFLFIHCATACLYLKCYPNVTNTANHDIVRLVLLHAVLLTELPLAYRGLSMDDQNIDSHGTFLHVFHVIQNCMCKILSFLSFQNNFPKQFENLEMNVCDIWDGRFLFKLLSLILSKKQDDILLSRSTNDKFVSLLNKVSEICAIEIHPFPVLNVAGNSDDFLSLVKTLHQTSHTKSKPIPLLERTSKVNFQMEGLIKVDCSLLTKYASEILDSPSLKFMDDDDSDIDHLITDDDDFDEVYHWHSGKPLSDQYERTKDNETAKDKWALKQKAKFANFQQKYGESLLGESSFPPIIVNDKKNKKQVVKTSKKAEMIKEENNRKKQEKIATKNENDWKEREPQINSLLEKGKYDEAFDNLKFLSNITHEKTKFKMLMMETKIHWKKWCEFKRAKDVEACFLLIRDILENYKQLVDNKKVKQELVLYLNDLGFNDIAIKTGLTDKVTDSKKEDASRYQLQNIGHLLKRSSRTDPDKRVEKFIPDTWQRELLNAVDNNQSALIVAPTSSGKTYVSYYCIEKVLKEDDDGIVVYVSPTKALVNQVAATCDVRYKKNMPPGKAIYGIFTRDYRKNALNCQILITVPQCFEILLLSPGRQEWAAKIKYVIFDEVHCIGSEIGAEVWEHLLLMIRSPYLALSATIFNPQVLHHWLQTAEDGKHEQDKENKCVRINSPKSYEVALVIYDERYNDLERYKYVINKNCGLIQHIHPCSVLTSRQLVGKDEFPSHITLSPREALSLYDAMKECLPGNETIEQLSPEEFFKEKCFISRQDARNYERCLKKEFMTLNTDIPCLENVITALAGENMTPENDFTARMNDICPHIIDLVNQLNDNSKLPMIAFNYDRQFCEDLAEVLVVYLKKKEKKIKRIKKESSRFKRNEKIVDKHEKEKKRQRDKEIEETKAHKSCRGDCETTFLLGDDIEEGCSFAGKGFLDEHDAHLIVGKLHRNVGSSLLKEYFPRGIGFHHSGISCRGDCETTFLLGDDIEEGCSFAGKGFLDEHDAHLIVGKLHRNVGSSLLKECLPRGIGFHHSGMSSLERRCVEMLFRKKFLRVVFATGTLALGIHMPCKTVVFINDSVFLNTLQYHQISGRAGRRGSDFLGEVIFFNIPEAKIQRLMTVPLARIIGNFPLNITLVLRLLLMVNKCENPLTAEHHVLTMLKNPLICQEQQELELQLKHHFLFSVDLLIRQGLLGLKGNPKGLAGLATHLHYHEPANLVFVSFLKKGLFHDLCENQRAQNGKYSKEMMKSLVVILSHLFARRELHDFIISQPRSTSKLILEKLPESFEEELDDYNSAVIEVFDLYLRTVALHVFDRMGEDITLPLSNYTCIPSNKHWLQSEKTGLVGNLEEIKDNTSCNNEHENQATSSEHNDAAPMKRENVTLEEQIMNSSLRYKACSAFAALSGHTDTQLCTSKNLISNIRYQVYTDVKVIPTLEIMDCEMNSYAFDFFNHGNKKALINENGLQAGDVFNLLKDFLLVIKSIHVSLTELAEEPESDDVVIAFQQLVREYSIKFKDAFGYDIF